MKEYVRAAQELQWLLPAFEDSLHDFADGSFLNFSNILTRLGATLGRPVPRDHVLVAANALCDLEVLARKDIRFRLNHPKLKNTEGFRHGVHAACRVFFETSVPPDTPQLCVSLPPNLTPAAEQVILESSVDLRSSLLDVVAAAKEKLIVASPFWDAATTADLVTLARKKIKTGVRVILLGRFSEDLPPKVRTELRKIASDERCSVLSWYEGEGYDTQTFHFKAVSADCGVRAYLGSANMTASSLRSRMELGVILTGTAAAQLDRVLRVVVTMASRVTV